MSDYKIQVDMFYEEKERLEAAARLSGFNKLHNPDEYIKNELQGLLTQYLDNHTVDEFLDMIPEDVYWKIHNCFESK